MRIRGPTREEPTQKVTHTWNIPKGPHVSQLEVEVDQPGP
jgi:hypothetical protein